MKILNAVLLIYICVVFLIRDQLVPGQVPLEFQFLNSVILLSFLSIAVVQLLALLAYRLPHSVITGLFGALILGTIAANEILHRDIAAYRANQPAIAAVAEASFEPVTFELNRAWDGHFRALAQLEGTEVGFLVDTGSSLVLLRHDDALRSGIAIDELTYSIPLTTAGGASSIAPYMFEEIRIGDVIIRDVKGGIAMPGALHSSLLGMSFIEGLDQMVIQKDRIIFVQ